MKEADEAHIGRVLSDPAHPAGPKDPPYERRDYCLARDAASPPFINAALIPFA